MSTSRCYPNRTLLSINSRSSSKLKSREGPEANPETNSEERHGPCTEHRDLGAAAAAGPRARPEPAGHEQHQEAQAGAGWDKPAEEPGNVLGPLVGRSE